MTDTESSLATGSDLNIEMKPPIIELSVEVDGDNDELVTNKPPRPLALPLLRVEQLKEEGNSSGTFSNSDSEFSDGDIMNRLGEFVEPSQELAEEICRQMEYYFSDANILKDSFLLKHARRNKQGYVNLKLITSFKKMKTLTKDYRQVAWSLRELSQTLIVNDDGNKVRRKIPLPDYDETKPSRTILAVNIPDKNPSIESISALFKHCGDIALVQILRPGKSVPTDIKKHLEKHPEVGDVVCAIVEFEKHSQAETALAMSVEGDDWKQELKVVMLQEKKSLKDKGDDSESEAEVSHKKRNKKKTHRNRAKLDRDYGSSGSEGDFLMPRPRSRHNSYGSESSRSGNGFNRASLSPTGNRALSPTNPPAWSSLNGSPISAQRRRSVPLPQSPLAENAKASPKASPRPSPRSSPRTSPEMRRRANSGSAKPSPSDGGSNSTSPWVQRRMQASREMSPLAKGTKKDDTVLRQPKGPEGKGFYGGKGRGMPLSNEC